MPAWAATAVAPEPAPVVPTPAPPSAPVTATGAPSAVAAVAAAIPGAAVAGAAAAGAVVAGAATAAADDGTRPTYGVGFLNAIVSPQAAPAAPTTVAARVVVAGPQARR
jgi:hypothetical protein